MCSLNTFGVESQMGLIGLKSRCWPGFISSGDSGGDPCLFQLLEAACVPQLIVPFSNFKEYQFDFQLHLHIPCFLTLTL